MPVTAAKLSIFSYTLLLFFEKNAVLLEKSCIFQCFAVCTFIFLALGGMLSEHAGDIV